MSDTSATGESHGDTNQSGGLASDARKELFFRLLFMLVFWFLSNIVFSFAIFLGFVQFVVILVTGDQNAELKRFHRNLVQFIWHCLAYVGFMREDKPFPCGPFPSVDEADDAIREPKPADAPAATSVTVGKG